LIRLRSGAVGHPVRTLCGMAYNYVITYRLVLWVIVVLKQEESLIIPLSWFFRDYVGQVYSWTKTYSSISPTNIYSCCRFIAFTSRFLFFHSFCISSWYRYLNKNKKKLVRPTRSRDAVVKLQPCKFAFTRFSTPLITPTLYPFLDARLILYFFVLYIFWRQSMPYNFLQLHRPAEPNN